MAQQTMTIKMEQMLSRTVVRALQQIRAERTGAQVAEGGAWSPITIQAPDGCRYLFVDEIGESHWPTADLLDAARARGWRQAFTQVLAA